MVAPFWLCGLFFLLTMKQGLFWLFPTKSIVSKLAQPRFLSLSKKTTLLPRNFLTKTLFPRSFIGSSLSLFALMPTQSHSTEANPQNSSNGETCSASSVEPVAPVENKPTEYFRADYQPTLYKISQLNLDFQLDEAETIVNARSIIHKNFPVAEIHNFTLNGDDLELLQVSINKQSLAPQQYEVTQHKLVILASTIASLVPSSDSTFELSTTVKIKPDKNSALSGLYKSGHLLCTQCEAMGFRRITYYLDRPDVLSVYKVRLEGDKTKYPILLSNGNRLEAGEVAGTNRHWTLWEDPFPKPSYLFALVAGDLASIHDTYTTTSGRVVQLGIYADHENRDQLDHAMYSLKASMKWDEDTFGLECDLDIYNVVATNYFNMGAMENKGLNIFNAAYVLADPRTATDGDYERILGVIGHEYFHNWSGNRVTVRDWFQLTLKEGLTVFRDQWFTSDLTSRAVKRIEDVKIIRSRQFAEDAGPMSHPIRPESYISMDNFYTITVYYKGAEIIGIYKNLLGEAGFKKGLKLYFDRHDGTAVTCDDFRNAMADANNVDLSQLDRWYSQSGTPRVKVEQQYDSATKTLRLIVSQRTPTTPGANQREEEKKPFLIPLFTGLLDSSTGKEIVPSTLLVLKEAKQEFTFENVPTKPILSILRDFSAPVILELEQSDDELFSLIAHDTDAFNKWDAVNRYFIKILNQGIHEFEKQGDSPSLEFPSGIVSPAFLNSLRTLLLSAKNDPSKDKSLIAYALQLPDENTLMNLMPEGQAVPVQGLYYARKLLKQLIAKTLEKEIMETYLYCKSQDTGIYSFTPAEVGRRRLQTVCLDYIASLYDAPATTSEMKMMIRQLLKKRFDESSSMTDKLSAIIPLTSIPSIEKDEALQQFYVDAHQHPLVINKWFAIQANADYSTLLEDIKKLKTHADFLMTNPNRARSLLTTFSNNFYHFHQSSGKGYEFIANAIIEVDPINPQVASRLMSCFSSWKKFDANRKELMHQALIRIQNTPNLSSDTYEIVSRYLK